MKAVYSIIAVLMVLMAPVQTAQATEFFVTSVIREFPMKLGEVMHKDFYINAGANHGLKKGAFLDALRKMPVYDNINSKLLGDTNIKIARMKIIHVDKNFAIARLVSYFEKDVAPLGGYDSVMIGDLIEVSDKQ